MKKIIEANHDLLLQIAANHKTPCYVYSEKVITDRYKAYTDAFDEQLFQICYAVKANSNLRILKLLADLGAGFDVVSVGELKRVLLAGGSPSKTIFSGVGKTVEEIVFALEMGIEAFDIESLSELETIIEVAEEIEQTATISVRFNPDVDAKTHPYISTGLKDNKFGLTKEQAFVAYERAKLSPWINVVGINMHIGSQITDISAFKDALQHQAEFVQLLKTDLDIELEHINVGGGLGVCYHDETPILTKDWVDAIKKAYPQFSGKFVIEPGRSIIANAGILLSEVICTKEQSKNKFVVIDAAMNDYMRVALYQAYNEFENISNYDQLPEMVNIVGPICESTDSFAKKRKLAAKEGDILAIKDVGAYGFVMASNYNTRNRSAEVLITADDNYELIRKRETFEDLIANELIGDFLISE